MNLVADQTIEIKTKSNLPFVKQDNLPYEEVKQDKKKRRRMTRHKFPSEYNLGDKTRDHLEVEDLSIPDYLGVRNYSGEKPYTAEDFKWNLIIIIIIINMVSKLNLLALIFSTAYFKPTDPCFFGT